MHVRHLAAMFLVTAPLMAAGQVVFSNASDVFSVHENGRVAHLQLPAAEYGRWVDDSLTYADRTSLAHRVYAHFEDAFDFIMVVNNEEAAGGTTYGTHYEIRNDVSGVGKTILDTSDSYGSAGVLQSMVRLTSKYGISGGPSLHELGHQWASFLDTVPTAIDGHWGYSSAGGQEGGWKHSSLVNLGGGLYDADGPSGGTTWSGTANGGNSIPFADIELYLMGLIPAEEVTNSIIVAQGFAWANQSLGTFTATNMLTVTMANIIAGDGARTPAYGSAQTNFRSVVVILSDEPMTADSWQYFDSAIAAFSTNGSDGSSSYNFWEATGGRATIRMDGLTGLIRPDKSYVAALETNLLETVVMHGEEPSPSNVVYTLTNRFASPLAWTAEVSEAWVSCEPAGGTIAAGGRIPVNVSLNNNALSLPPGEHDCTVGFRSLSNDVVVLKQVSLTLQDFASPPYTEDFEAWNGSAYWTFTGTAEYRTRVSTNWHPHGGSAHLCMDDSISLSLSSRNESVLRLDLLGYTNVVLSFWAQDYGDESHSPPASPFAGGTNFDGVAISADGTNWYEVQSLRGMADTNYTSFSVNLDAAVAARGLTYSNRFWVLFNHYDNFSMNESMESSDGITIDDVTVTGDLAGSDIFSIAATAGVNGAISPAGITPVRRGSSREYTMSPDAHHHVFDVLVDSVSIGATNNYWFSNVQTNHDIYASFEADSNSLTVTSARGTTFPAAGVSWYGYGTTVDCHAAEQTDGTTQYVCRGWSGAGSVPVSGTTTNTGPFAMTVNSSITWAWRTNYWLDAGTNGPGSVNVADGWFGAGSNAVITAAAASHHHFSGWSGTGVPGGSELMNPLTVSMTGPKAVTASFAAASPVLSLPGEPLQTALGNSLSFTVSATDEDVSDVPAWIAQQKPASAVLTDNGDGTARFDWTPALPGEVGSNLVILVASDGTLATTGQVAVQVSSFRVTSPTGNATVVRDAGRIRVAWNGEDALGFASVDLWQGTGFVAQLTNSLDASATGVVWDAGVPAAAASGTGYWIRVTDTDVPVNYGDSERFRIIEWRRPTVQWTPTSGATYYQLSIYRSGVKYFDQWLKQTTTTWTASTDFKGGTYTWWVRPYCPASGNGAWQGPYSFTIPAILPGVPTLLSPTGTVATNRPLFTWDADPYTTSYNLSVQRDSSAYLNKWIAGTSYTPTSNIPLGVYKWWVRGWNPDGNGAWSSVTSFTYGVSAPLTPTGVVAGTRRPVFCWSAATGASQYYVYVKKAGAVYQSKWVAGLTSCTFAVDMPGTNYQWWVRTWNSKGYGPWSAAASFSIPFAKPSTTVLVSPAETAAGSSIAYVWQADPAATQHELLIHRNNVKWFDKWYKAGSQTGLLTNNVSGHTVEATYKWWVRAWGPDGYGPWSASATFTAQ